MVEPIKMKNSRLRPRKLYLANANPASELKKSTATVTVAAINRLLTYHAPNGRCVNRRVYAVNCHVAGKSWGGKLKIWALSLNEAKIIQMNGTMVTNAARIATR